MSVSPMCAAMAALITLAGGCAQSQSSSARPLEHITQSQGQPVRNYGELPPEMRKEILVGVPRKSAEIPDSPFGTHTVVMSETTDPKLMPGIVKLLSEAGYKWVTDYVNIPKAANDQELQQKTEKSLQHAVEYARALSEAKINLLMRIDAIPWRPITDEELKSPDLWRRSEIYTRAAVRALKPYTRRWQIWNEPNLGNAKPMISPEGYVMLVQRVGKIIREEQPDALILGPGTAMLQCMADKPFPWLPQALDAGLAKNVDVISFHPYRQGYERVNIPEHASEFSPWKQWGTYYKQIEDLRGRIRAANGGKDLPLAATEDGAPNLINGRGEQQITWVIGAKYELRKSLQDFWLGIYPRTQFCMYRALKDPFYESEASFNMITADFEKKPIYYAAQNLNAVLDSSYLRDESVPVKFTLEHAQPLGECGLYVQSYTKSHPTFDELLVFFWSTEPAEDYHLRHKAQMQVAASGWEAPVAIDLMAMPAPRAKQELIELVNPEYRGRVDARPLQGKKVGGGVTAEVEIRDYPMLVKWIRPK